MFDVIVIGGGIIGGSILRELTKYRLNVCLLEKEDDVCMGQSRANSGIVHAGFDAVEGSLKAKFNVLGSALMENYAKELGVKYINNGALVVAFNDEDVETIKNLKKRGEINGVSQLEIIDKETLKKLVPNISDDAICALHAKSSSIVCPYELTIASIGNAMDNGAQLFTNFEVVKIDYNNGVFKVFSNDDNIVEGKIVINASGINGGKISRLVNDNSYNIKGRKGEYILVDRESGDFVSKTLFFTPTKKGKGILITNTVDGNVLFGPTSKEIDDTTPTTESLGFEEIITASKKMTKNPPLYNTITSFAGVRAFSADKHDFIIEESKVQPNFINVIGIESPGLSASPAIAKYVVEDLVSKMVKLTKNEDFNGIRKPDYFFKNLSTEEKNQIIAKNGSYGKIICRCEQITEGEIVRAIHENPKATNLDAIKRRVRAGMGRCQGGFCGPLVAEILARELNVSLLDVTKFGKGSNLLVEETK